MKTAVVTIISNNHTAKAKTLLQSLQQHEPGLSRYVLIVDKALDPPLISPEEATLFYPENLPLPNNDLFFLQYSTIEATTAVKPWAIEHVMDQGYEAVIYLDSDIKVYSPLEELRQALESHDILLTPHTLKPYPDDSLPNEATIRLSGIFNLGFAAFRHSERARTALRWWKTKLLHNCRVASAEGVFLDQGWMDFAPHYFGAYSFNEPGYNVSYWNLHERRLEAGQPPGAHVVMVNKKPLRFMHFSGFDPTNPRELSKHQTRHRSAGLSKEVIDLMADYADCLDKNGYGSFIQLSPETSAIKFKIPYLLRPHLFTPDFIGRFLKEAPSRTELLQFIIRYFCQPDPEYKHLPLFLGRFYAVRPDLQQHFRSCKEGGAVNEFLIWFESCGRRECDFDPRFPTLGWWTNRLNPPTQFMLCLHRILFNAGIR